MTNTENHCFNCKHWRLVIPNLGGLVDLGVCELYCIKRFEDDECGKWAEQSEDDRQLQIYCRQLINDTLSERRADVESTCKQQFERDMRERVLKIFGLKDEDTW